MGGRLTLNAAAFFYDYSNYQVSQIRDRTAINENFDAKVWGAELSAQFEPVDRLRINANIGWLGSRIAKGEQSIDPMNRSEEHTSELQSLMRISYAVFTLLKENKKNESHVRCELIEQKYNDLLSTKYKITV